MQILVTIALVVIAVLLFELIIGLHEFGHFITAKLSGIKVNEFALGMGPKLFSFKKGETQYSLRLFPIGGYCAMEGEDEDSPEPRSFNNAKVWKRMIVIIAGAVMNIILGIIFSFIMVIPQEAYSSTTVEQFDPRSYSANCGLQIGDKIVKVNGYDITIQRIYLFRLQVSTVKMLTVSLYPYISRTAQMQFVRSTVKLQPIKSPMTKHS